VAERDNKVLWPVAAAFAVAVVGVCLAVFSSDPATSLRLDNPHHNSASSAFNGIPVHTPYVFISDLVCVAHGAVTIDRVDVHDPSSGIEVVDWAVAKKPGNYSDLGSPGRADHLSGFGGKSVSAPCAAPTFLAISVQLTDQAGYTSGFEVHSTSGSVIVPHGVQLCVSACPKGLPYSGTP
jgi:hypothetical protein